MSALKEQTSSLEEQLEILQLANYPGEIGKTGGEYDAEFRTPIQAAQDIFEEGITLALVDPRVAFERQLELLGINLDPAVFSKPVQESSRRPYVARLRLIKPDDPSVTGYSLGDRVRGLSWGLRPATPYEGLTTHNELLKDKFYVMPGGLLQRNEGLYFGLEYNQRYLAMERYLGKPRVSHVSKNTRDFLIGVLAVVQ